MIYRIGAFELDTAKVELRADGQLRHLEPQVFALLALLVEHRERVLSTDELIEKVWDGRPVSDAAIASRIKSVRQVLGDDGKSQRFVRTIHRQGFRFVAEVSVSPDMDPAWLAEPTSQPSIAVLPFRLLGTPGPYAAMADALPHELIAELSRLHWLLVTARGSSFRLGPCPADTSEVGRLLGVHYCLSGTVEITGKRMLVTVELVDTRNGAVVWADRFGGVIDDVHQIRAEILALTLAAIELRIPLHEAARARLSVSENLDAWSAFHLGLQHVYRFNRKDNAAAKSLFQQAIARDAGFARAHAGLSFVHFQTAFLHNSDDLPREIRSARQFAERGLELDPLDPFVSFAMGRTFWLEGDLEGGRAWLEHATSISPNYAQGIYALAWTEALSGQAREGRGHVDLAMRLSPLDPLYYAMVATRAFTHLVVNEFPEAAVWAERAARSPGAHVLIAMVAAAAHELAGNKTSADAWADNVRARKPALTRDAFFRSFPMKPEASRARISGALARCGF